MDYTPCEFLLKSHLYHDYSPLSENIRRCCIEFDSKLHITYVSYPGAARNVLITQISSHMMVV